jgi:hypothetical protein
MFMKSLGIVATAICLHFTLAVLDYIFMSHQRFGFFTAHVNDWFSLTSFLQISWLAVAIFVAIKIKKLTYKDAPLFFACLLLQLLITSAISSKLGISNSHLMSFWLVNNVVSSTQFSFVLLLIWVVMAPQRKRLFSLFMMAALTGATCLALKQTPSLFVYDPFYQELSCCDYVPKPMLSTLSHELGDSYRIFVPDIHYDFRALSIEAWPYWRTILAVVATGYVFGFVFSALCRIDARWGRVFPMLHKEPNVRDLHPTSDKRPLSPSAMAFALLPVLLGLVLYKVALALDMGMQDARSGSQYIQEWIAPATYHLGLAFLGSVAPWLAGGLSLCWAACKVGYNRPWVWVSIGALVGGVVQVFDPSLVPVTRMDLGWGAGVLASATIASIGGFLANLWMMRQLPRHRPPSPHRHSLPEIAGEAPPFVPFLDTKRHADGRATVDFALLNIGNVHEDAPAAVKVDLAVMIGRVHGIGQEVRRIGQDFPTPLRKIVRLLGVHFRRIGCDRHARARILHRARDATFPAHKAQNRIIIAIKRGQRGLVILLRPHAFVPLHKAIEDEVFHVARLVLSVREPA